MAVHEARFNKALEELRDTHPVLTHEQSIKIAREFITKTSEFYAQVRARGGKVSNFRKIWEMYLTEIMKVDSVLIDPLLSFAGKYYAHKRKSNNEETTEAHPAAAATPQEEKRSSLQSLGLKRPGVTLEMYRNAQQRGDSLIPRADR